MGVGGEGEVRVDICEVQYLHLMNITAFWFLLFPWGGDFLNRGYRFTVVPLNSIDWQVLR